ncbi:MAG TPA: hypothetical protein VEV42_11330 [Pyrinomonadaceae bacterium]|jgi:hypothetical protein|nr:hypothetical protein [Pyrinomonadaceae bacterium]
MHRATHRVISSRLQFAIAMLALVSIASPTMTSLAVTIKNQDPPKPENVKVIPDGTEFTVVTIEEISSKTASEGDPLTFKVAEDVKIDGQVVIAKDTLVKGVIANAKKAGMMGRGGSLGIRVESTTTVDNQKLKLRSSKGKEGDDKTGTTVALVVLFGPLGFLKHGKNAKIKAGTEIKVYSDEEKRVEIKK